MVPTTEPDALPDLGAADRAAGVLLGLACGDALGAPYEFGPPLGPEVPVHMHGGGPFGWSAGEWTDDTQMAVPLLVAAESARLVGEELLDRLDDVATAWVDWSRHASDVGAQTRSVIAAAVAANDISAAGLAQHAREHHYRTGRSGGNGSLMRTAPVALAYLAEADRLVEAARSVSEMTHFDPDAGDACVLWCLAIRNAVFSGELSLEAGLTFLPTPRRDLWAHRIAEAEVEEPVAFANNGWVVHALQCAWSAICRSDSAEPEFRLRTALENAVRAGGDTDTVAAIAGSLIGAGLGWSAFPADWTDVVHGWPGLTGLELAARGLAIADGAL